MVVFSMDGDIADLPALAREAKAKGAWLMVDDAQGISFNDRRLAAINAEDMASLI